MRRWSYRHPDGRILFIDSGLGGRTWGTFYRKPNGRLCRYKSPEMPMCGSEEEAQRNLNTWAALKGLLPAGELSGE